MQLLKLVYKAARGVFARVGVLSVLLLAAGTFADILAFDRTRGGYEAPYSDYRGEPIDWSLAATTATGMVGRGYILDTEINCTTGTITFEAFGLRIPFRQFPKEHLWCTSRGKPLRTGDLSPSSRSAIPRQGAM